MNSVEFLSHLRTLDIAVRLDGDQLQVDAPRGALTDDLRAQLSTRKAELVALLRESGTRTEAGGIERIPRDSPLPLSPVQQGLWLLDQMEPDSAAYVMSNAMRLHGELDAAALGAGLSEIVRRHEPLRTVFRSHAGAPHQVVNAAGAVDLPVVDLRGLPEDERIAEAERLAAANAHETFDLAAGPLLRVKLLRLGEQDHVLLMAAHHIVFDGWSAGIFARELSALYAAHRTGAPSPLPEPPIQFVDFASWQRRTLEAGERDRHLAYWTRQLAGDLEPLELPADRPRRDLRDARGASCSCTSRAGRRTSSSARPSPGARAPRPRA